MDSLYKSEKIQCQHQAIWFNSFNQIITNTLTGDIMVLFLTDVLLFKTIDITFILSLIPLISIIRLPLIIFTRVKNYTKIIRISVIVKMIFVILLLLVPLNLLGFYRYSVLIIIYQIAVEFGVGICWQPLMREITTTNDRGRFFGKMRFVFMTLNSLYVFFISVFIGETLNEIQYKFLLFVCFAGLCIQYYAISKLGNIKGMVRQAYLGNKRSIKDQLFDNKKILRALLLDIIFLCAGVTLNIVYLKSVLMYSSKIVSIYITVFNISSTLLLPFIGRLLDRNYKKGITYICLVYVFYLIILLNLPFSNRQTSIILIPTILYAIISGIISSGVYLLMTILQHGLISKNEDSFVVLNIYQMIIYISTFVVTNVMGHIITYSENVKFTIGIFTMDPFKIATTVIVICCIIIVKITSKNIALS